MKKIGVLEAVNKKSGDFSQEDMYFTQALAGIVSIVIRNIALFSELSNRNNMIKSILDSMPGGFIAVDPAGRIIEFNLGAGRILGFGSSVQKMMIREVLKMQPEMVEVLMKTADSGETANRLILTTVKRNGEKLIIGYGTVLLKSEDGQVIGSGMIFQDLTKIQGLP